MLAGLLTLALALAVPASWARADSDPVVGKAQVIDGDTVTMVIRFFGIDTPEKAQWCRDAAGACYPCGQVAMDALRELTARKDRIRCVRTGASTYGRSVAICYDGETDLGLEMLRRGMAVVLRRYLKDLPDKKGAYLAAETDAREAKRGIWAGEFVPPQAWRHGKRLGDGCE